MDNLFSVIEILQLSWTVQGCTFQSDAKVLSLAHFDIIVGMDWLARFSPMQVDWEQKWLLIPYNGSYQLLHGEFESLPLGSWLGYPSTCSCA